MNQPQGTEGVAVQCSITGAFPEWLARADGSLAVTTYQAGKVALVGWDGRQVTLLLRQFTRPMGLAVDGPRLALATRLEVWRFANDPVLAPTYLENQPGRYDALYLPRALHLTGQVNAHDLAFGRDELWLVNTRFSCLATLSDTFNFVPRWRPPWVTALAPEDRCHLNGLAMIDGRPRYMTALGRTDAAGAWRTNRATGGVLLDVDTGEVVLDGLAMPHSPRWHDGKLWLLSSGTGELWVVDPERREHTVVCALPGYLRGLCFAGPFAVVGLSRIREKHTFGGLPLQQHFAELVCGVAVVDLKTGRTVGLLEFTVGCLELYDVQFLPGVRRPMILNLDKEAVGEAITAPESSWWLRASAALPDDPAAPAAG